MSARRRKCSGATLAATDGFALHREGALYGDRLLAELCSKGFDVRRYGDQAGLDDQYGLGRIPPLSVLYAFRAKQSIYSAALLELRAPEAPVVADGRPFPIRRPDALERARMLLARLRGLGFHARIDVETGALVIADALGARRDLSRFLRPADVFNTLNDGLDADPNLLVEKEKSDE